MERSWTVSAIDLGAAAALGTAVAFASTLLGAGLAGAAAGALAFAAAAAVLRRIPADPSWSLPTFELAEPTADDEAKSDGLTELLLTDRLCSAGLDSASHAIAEELLLEDVLASPAADSRVVQLFGDRPIPTAGELQANIVRHLEQRGSPLRQPDAASALSAALAELRRSLR
jgi:hypothetical protein